MGRVVGGDPWGWGVRGWTSPGRRLELDRAIELCSSLPHLPADVVFLAPSGLVGCRAHLFPQRSASTGSWVHTGLLPAPLGPQSFPAEIPLPDSHPSPLGSMPCPSPPVCPTPEHPSSVRLPGPQLRGFLPSGNQPAPQPCGVTPAVLSLHGPRSLSHHTRPVDVSQRGNDWAWSPGARRVPLRHLDCLVPGSLPSVPGGQP